MTYEIQSDYKAWKLPPKKAVPPKKSLTAVQKGCEVPPKTRHTKYNKDNIQKINASPALQAVFERVFNEGLNIYQLVAWLKMKSKIPIDIPEKVLIKVCDQFFRDKSQIKDQWAWFFTVFQAESSKYFAEQNILEAQQY